MSLTVTEIFNLTPTKIKNIIILHNSLVARHFPNVLCQKLWLHCRSSPEVRGSHLNLKATICYSHLEIIMICFFLDDLKFDRQNSIASENSALTEKSGFSVLSPKTPNGPLAASTTPNLTFKVTHSN